LTSRIANLRFRCIEHRASSIEHRASSIEHRASSIEPVGAIMAAMKVDVRHVDDVIIVDLEGRLVMGVGDELLRDVMNELVAEDWKKILLNLRKVSIIDSSGIGEVVSGWKLAGRFGALVKLLRPAPQVERTLKLTQLLPLLEVYDDEGEAIASF
jgi:anti-sigma B factor antagonist